MLLDQQKLSLNVPPHPKRVAIHYVVKCIVRRPCSDDGERLSGNTSQVPVLALRFMLLVGAYAGVQTAVVSVDDVNQRSLGTSDL